MSLSSLDLEQLYLIELDLSFEGSVLSFSSELSLALELLPFLSVGGGSAAQFSFTQGSASATWTINHNLGFYPNVEVRSVGGKEMLGEVLHASVNQVIVYFDSAFAGTATCS